MALTIAVGFVVDATLPSCARSISSNLSHISCSWCSERVSFQAGKTIVSSRAAWFW
jgi:hypothetical protein